MKTKNPKVKEKHLTVFGSSSTNEIIKKIADEFQEGVDYAVVIKDKKPTLLIPGADKILFKFNLMAVCKRDLDAGEMLKDVKGLIAFICELINRNTGKKIGEGRGAAMLGEGGNCKSPNSAIKMAEIRATRDAVLRTFPLRDRFTQDMEDQPIQELTKISVSENGDVSL